ncbi:Uncharacterized protein Fot_27292 [Forsythia ovata]|uniref:Uncharacterized protein n=1 Tax=Forsythia ovata TaxID=205694 RepID=A0ABD1UEA5_9LAMI
MVLDNKALYDICFQTLKLTTPSCVIPPGHIGYKDILHGGISRITNGVTSKQINHSPTPPIDGPVQELPSKSVLTRMKPISGVEELLNIRNVQTEPKLLREQVLVGLSTKHVIVEEIHGFLLWLLRLICILDCNVSFEVLGWMVAGHKREREKPGGEEQLSCG